MGSGKADWARPLLRLSNLLRRTNKDIVAVLEPGSEVLANVQQEFHTMLEDRRRNEGKLLDIFCFYEEIAYPSIGEIVPKQSAILPAYPNASIHQDHSAMTKFSGENDAGFIRLRDQLWLWIDRIPKEWEKPGAREAVPLETETPTQRPYWPSGVESGGGPIFLGNLSAGRDTNV